MKTISICIPTYEMKGQGSIFLKESFDHLASQTFKDFDVIVSDHSQDNTIELLCEDYADRLDIHYYRNSEKRGSSSANINNAIRHATGKLIKILFQDDFLYHDRALEYIVKAFDLEHDHWLMTGCTHTSDGSHFFRPLLPRPEHIRQLWIRTVFSSPSTMTIKNDRPLLFNEELIWQMDNDYYRRYYEQFGMPKILNDINIANRVGSHQVTNTIANRMVQKREYRLMLKRYEKGLRFWYYRVVGDIKDFVKHLIGKV